MITGGYSLKAAVIHIPGYYVPVHTTYVWLAIDSLSTHSSCMILVIFCMEASSQVFQAHVNISLIQGGELYSSSVVSLIQAGYLHSSSVVLPSTYWINQKSKLPNCCMRLWLSYAIPFLYALVHYLPKYYYKSSNHPPLAFACFYYAWNTKTREKQKNNPVCRFIQHALTYHMICHGITHCIQSRHNLDRIKCMIQPISSIQSLGERIFVSL